MAVSDLADPPSASPALPERRQLTVMFCDLVDSTGLAQTMDPEDLRHIIIGFQERARRVVARYEGFVARYMGDGVLAYFGFPLAHEDDTVRAVHAGLEIVEGRPEGGPMVRAGIATGLVVVGDWIGEGGSREAAAVGESVNLAARLQSVAEPGAVFIGERTMQLVEGRFFCVDQGRHVLKGFGESIPIWRALGATQAESRFDAHRAIGLTPFVGRTHELELMLDRWRASVAGSGQVVAIVGEPGIGKTRLVEALTTRIAEETSCHFRWQCSPYHVNSALHPFIRQLEREAGILPTDPPEAKLEKLQVLLLQPGIDSSSMPLLAELLSLPDTARYPMPALTPQQRKTRVMSALAERVHAQASRMPVAMIVEDAHWIDPTSMELLQLIMERAREQPVALFVTTRAPLEVRGSFWQQATTLTLERLSASESAVMVKSLAASSALPTEVVADIVSMTDGVPLFIEECTKAVGLQGGRLPHQSRPPAAKLQVPWTLQDSLTARLDQLGEAKNLAQMAAVLGREVPSHLLALLCRPDKYDFEGTLQQLLRSGIVRPREPGAPTADRTYIFKHALVQEAAYAGLLLSRRQELHQRAAALLEQSFPGRSAAEPEVLAFHLAQAGQALRASGFMAIAARRALDRSDNVEALGHVANGLALLQTLGPDAARDRAELGLTVLKGAAFRALEGFASIQVEQNFQRALALCEKLDERIILVDVRRGLFSFYYARGALAQAREQGAQVVELARRTGDRNGQMLGYWMLGCMDFWGGDVRGARTKLEHAVALQNPEALATATLALQIDPVVNALSHLSWTLWIAGEPDLALETSARAVRTARGLAQPLALSMALFFSCATHANCGLDSASRALLRELFDLTSEHGLGYLHACAKVLMAQQLISEGRLAEGIAEVDQALADFSGQEAGLGRPWTLSILASGYLKLGDIPAGLAATDRALLSARHTGEHHWLAMVWLIRAELAAAAHPVHPIESAAPTANDEAVACTRRALEIAQAAGAYSIALRCTLQLCRLLVERNAGSEAIAMLDGALHAVHGGQDTADVREARQLKERLCIPLSGAFP